LRTVSTLVAIFASCAFLAVACGSRTGLFGGDELPVDAGIDVTIDVTLDHGLDAPHDHAADVRPDAAHIDAGRDSGILCNAGTCASFGYQCGLNGDGCGKVIDCGQCPAPQVCGVKQYSQCAIGPPCVPKTCADLGFNCGPAGDGCGNLLQCGICQYPDACGGGGRPGHCGNTLPCTNLCQQQVACDSGTTTVTGTVLAATPPQFGTPDPVYNVLVYVPNAPVLPFQPGVQCSQCGADVSGQPLVATQTGADGTFTLTNMPVGSNIPLVIQLGRWRRQIVIPNVSACTTTALPTDLTRMPRNQTEGDIPNIAVATGNADATECVLMKMGIDQSEFGPAPSTGRVNMYISNGADDGPGTPAATLLWSNPATLAQYDMIVLPCEGKEILKLQSDQQNVINYMSAGGRMFTTHYGYTWLFNDPPFSTTAFFNVGQNTFRQITGQIDNTFVKGQAYDTWLQTVGALSGPSLITIDEARQDLDGVASTAQRFIYAQSGGFPLQYAFYTPVGAPQSQQCGRVVFSDFHVQSGQITGGLTFPTECTAGPMTAQEKALEFMLFDLASCIPPAPVNCTPRSCSQQGIQCGPAGDGCGGQLDCGPCAPPETCGAGPTHYVCGESDAGICVPKTCADLGFTCGLNGDGCGSIIDCGTCAPPKICGGGGRPSVCGP
jgi:hypothetical protein